MLERETSWDEVEPFMLAIRATDVVSRCWPDVLDIDYAMPLKKVERPLLSGSYRFLQIDDIRPYGYGTTWVMVAEDDTGTALPWTFPHEDYIGRTLPHTPELVEDDIASMILRSRVLGHYSQVQR